MVVLDRALEFKSNLLMLEEPFLGLSPKLIGSDFDKIMQTNQKKGVSILIVEQKVQEAPEICNRAYSILTSLELSPVGSRS